MMLFDRKIISFITLLMSTFYQPGLAQQLEYGPLSSNPSLQRDVIKQMGATIDSMFVFSTDTLQLPLFDDFSSNKFQQYFEDYEDPSITSELFYYLSNPVTSLPLSADVQYTNQQTFKRTFDFSTNQFEDEIFNPTSVKVADLEYFPVQYEQLSLYPPYYLYDTINGININTTDTVWLTNPQYIQDSARVFFQTVSDPSKYWLDESVYWNHRFAIDPRSVGVATFDGLDENGNPYQYGSISPNYADALTSKTIDLSTFGASDSIYLSFLYQPQGFGDEPENGDSLIVEFYQANDSNWERVWSVEGSPTHPFKAVTIPVLDSEYFTNGFKFRFRNYGSLAGALDHFHIDYVHLRRLSFAADTLFKDFAFSYPITSLLDKYTSVPWDHYQNSDENRMTDSLEVKLHNGSPLPENYQDGQVNVSYNGAVEGSYELPGQTLAEGSINFQPRTTHQSFHNLMTGYEFDKAKPGNQQVFEIKSSASAQFPNFGANDSILFYQSFYNYYSYDDGSAEAAFGPTGSQSRLAIGYNAYEEDSILGVSICFVPTVNDVSDKLFLLTVWADDNGKPGEVLYEDGVFDPRSPISGYGENYFQSYYLMDTMRLPVPTRFYVGWRQFDPERLNAGLDRNTNSAGEIFYSVDGGNSWPTSPFLGSAMIRPIFSTRLNDVLGIEEKLNEHRFYVYPNPASEILHVNIANSEKFEGTILDIFGKLVKQTLSDEIQLGDLAPGTYFLSSPFFKGKVLKFIKQ